MEIQKKSLTFFLCKLDLRKLEPMPVAAFSGCRQEDILKNMQWNRSNTIGLSQASCTYCHGHGLRLVRKGVEVPCNCVFRAIFCACWYRFKTCAAVGAEAGTVSWDFCRGPLNRRMYSRKREEYMADFTLVSQRVLDDLESKVFRYHFLLGADWKLCCRQLQMDRGDFFHAVYRIEQKLGRAFFELQPYSLYPPSEYFGGVADRAPRCIFPEFRPPRRQKLMPRLALTA